MPINPEHVARRCPVCENGKAYGAMPMCKACWRTVRGKIRVRYWGLFKAGKPCTLAGNEAIKEAREARNIQPAEAE